VLAEVAADPVQEAEPSMAGEEATLPGSESDMAIAALGAEDPAEAGLDGEALAPAAEEGGLGVDEGSGDIAADGDLGGDEGLALEEPEATDVPEEPPAPEMAESEVPAPDVDLAEPVSDFGDVEV
jgi:hypothetical protein